MDRRSGSIESPPRRYRNGSGNGGGNARRDYRRYSRSHSRSRSRDRRRFSRSHSRERMGSGGGPHRRGNSMEKDLYRDIIFDDYQDDKMYSGMGMRNHEHRHEEIEERDRYRGGGEGRGGGDRGRSRGRDYERERDYDSHRERDRDRDRRDRYGRHGGGGGSGGGGRDRRRHNSNDRERERERNMHSDDSDDPYPYNTSNKTPSNTLMVMGLPKHISESDIMATLIQQNMAATSIRLIRKRNSGASRGFAFVEFNTIEEAAHWMDITQGTLVLQDNSRAQLQFDHSWEQKGKRQNFTDWYCGKCGVCNFKRRENCFKCYASREESETGGEGCDEISNILTKKIMFRNLDVLTNEESVLTAMQQHAPDLAKKISKILVSRDPLTQTSRGICYLHFETLVDSMNLHNALTGLEPPLQIDNREVLVTYCIDHENRQIVPKKPERSDGNTASTSTFAGPIGPVGPMTAAEMAASMTGSMENIMQSKYTIADVPRLASYSASMYAATPMEHAHFVRYYTEYYMNEIRKGHYGNLPVDTQLVETSANPGAAVALSAIQRKQKKMNNIETTATPAAQAAAAAAASVRAAIAAHTGPTPKGNDGKVYPTPDVTLYQYDDTSGYYYDPTTGLYYDAHSQYYYNNETGAYLYWDQRKSTYLLATPGAVAASVQEAISNENSQESKPATTEEEPKKEKKEGNKPDKVKVAKKIVKDMEKWAKQLNQKKDYTAVATPQPILPAKGDEYVPKSSGSGYADVGFSILEKKERSKLTDFIPQPSGMAGKLLTNYGSDSEEEHAGVSVGSGGSNSANSALALAARNSSMPEVSEKDYVDFQRLTCLLCKRAFQSLDILQKHLKMSALHKENLKKHCMAQGAGSGSSEADIQEQLAQAYRDRAKERRLKYGEGDPPPPNRTRERFESEIKSLTLRKPTAAPPQMPIGSNNVGNRLLQKMGWSEGQGLGRKNQGRTNIIEAEARNSTAGLGTKGGIGPGDDYKTYIKKMMKSRYDSV